MGEPVFFTVQAPLAGTLFQWYATPGTVNSGVGDGTYASFSSLPAEIKVVRISTDAAQCVSDTLRKTIEAEMPPVSMSTNAPATVCGSTQWNFDLNYDNADLYEWKVLDPSMGSVVNGGTSAHVQVLFNNPVGATSQTVKVVVAVTKCNEVQRDTITLTVTNAPSFTVTPASSTYCAEEAVQFTISPTPTGYSSLNWTFGDGGSSSVANPSYAYASTGAVAIYHPAVTIVHPSGCLSTVSLQAGPISVKPTPVAHITPESIIHCGPFTDTLVAAVTTGVGSTTNFEWFGQSANPPNCGSCDTWPNIYQNGDYYVIVENSNGSSDTSNIVSVVEFCEPLCAGPKPLLISSDSTFLDCAKVSANVSYNANGTTVINESWVNPSSATIVSTTTGTSASVTATFGQPGVYTFIYVVTYLSGTDTCFVGFPQDVFVPFVGGMLYEVSCGTGSDYSVTLYDHSTIYPTETISHSYAYQLGAGPWVPIAGPSGALSATVPLPPGDYQLREIITSITTPLAPACTTIIHVLLPVKPAASFTIDAPYQPACIRDVVVGFTNNSSPGGLAFEWNFGDGSTNYQENPSRVYTSPSLPSGYIITLTATNTLGCISTASQSIVVKDNQYWNGADKPTITANPSTPPCQGSPVNLAYTYPTGYSILPQDFIWYMGNAAITPATSGLSSYPVTQPGGYRVIGSDQYGCRVPSQYKMVDFIQIPPAVISGSHQRCENEAFTLNGFAGNAPGLTYEWTRSPGGIVGTTASITESLPIGTYTYTLKLSLNGCESESVPFIVTVSGPPPPPSLSYSIIDCNPYLVQLNASNTQTGTFNWSNGANGSPAYASAGGYYLATFTAENGCTSQNSIYVEKSPEEFIWIFPTGCFCPSLFENRPGMSPTATPYYCHSNSPYITGPIVPFAEWAYLFDGSVDANGANSLVVNPYDNFLSLGAGVYNLRLHNGTCEVTSGDMYYGGVYCDLVGGKPAGMEGFDFQNSPMLRLIPNPATGQSLAEYRFAGNGTNRSLEVYDLLGRKVQTYVLESRTGSLMLPLSAFAAGMYQVCLREDGKVIAQSKLSVSR